MRQVEFHVEACNALGRAVPKLSKKVTGGVFKSDSPAWEEAYHVMHAASLDLFRLRGRIANECEPWFDGSAFPKSKRASDLGLNAGDDCPKCKGELLWTKHDYQTDGGAPDCGWLICLDCDYQTDPE